ncbi:succinate dehydrogenase flavoprotein subunit [Rubneribacter badeniensis]|uniref:succinate dehydrogenase n=1 Tax=Rubneribacter badeniensis TaxID=2070688 RepID=A0A2K2U325_9ACTN|nr:succinate dehydrogenase flavoprotein subunit [Rubneribacter badeniensis]OUO88064.1 succinate dehydrogenase flavoprotein subunit [Gordonibacter sp. An232A]PNV64664.1 succinate dehydrogenase flavoprotein subunit [Rubneribacter badeniensis]HJH43138.1 succinate dehydrogenase flavoprotein subunit [Rubneribacter badeniensis]
MAKNKVVVVGGGLAGLMATLKIAEAGIPVDLFSLVPVKRSHSACAQGGVNAAINTKGENDSTWRHLDDTVYGGDFLANQPQVKRMCDAAPALIHMFDRMGVMFNRTPEGLLDFRRFGGTLVRRTAYAGATTGQQLLYALDEQVRRLEVEGKVTKYEGWEFVSAIVEDGVCRGITAQNLATMEIVAFPADAVLCATGGLGAVFGKSTNSTINTGYAAARLYRQGATFANGEFIQIHPTAIPGIDKNRLMSESARGEGGRVWTYKDGKPWYFLEEKYPLYKNLVPRDVAAREIFDVCVNQKLGVDGQNVVYLDLSHIDANYLDNKLGGILEIYEKFVGDDPRKVPMKIFPSVHYSMGGLWVDIDQKTNVPGLFAAGECDYSQHGANRLGANSLLSAAYGGYAAGPSIVEYVQGLDSTYESVDEATVKDALARDRAEYEGILKLDGPVNPYVLHEELGALMTENVTIVRENAKLAATYEKLFDIAERYQHIGIDDRSTWSNLTAPFVRQLGGMIDLAKVITLGALNRNESRGSHYKPEFPDRNDEEWLKTTMASYDAAADAPVLSYEPVDVSLIKPRKRDYTKTKKEA